MDSTSKFLRCNGDVLRFAIFALNHFDLHFYRSDLDYFVPYGIGLGEYMRLLMEILIMIINMMAMLITMAMLIKMVMVCLNYHIERPSNAI